MNRITPLTRHQLVILNVLCNCVRPLRSRGHLTFLIFIHVIRHVRSGPRTRNNTSLASALLLCRMPRISGISRRNERRDLVLHIVIAGGTNRLTIISDSNFRRKQQRQIIQVLPRNRSDPLGNPMCLRREIHKGFFERTLHQYQQLYKL